jgi:alginate O-acetyltransferase complex protein AlgI
MLFNSFEFLYAFLPVTLVVFFLLRNPSAQILWLLAASLFHYAWWKPSFLTLLIFSMLVNYGLHVAIAGARERGRLLLAIGVAFNLSLLGFFKYAGFIAANLNEAFGTSVAIQVTLPLAISFFTFQQIALLVDTRQGLVGRGGPASYMLFVAFFPQLIAGPIVHHREMMPQFRRAETYRFRLDDFFTGLNLFILGLAKKVLIADQLAPFADGMFDAAARGAEPSLFEAWGGVLTYSLEIYFDFSGYADMAMGLARMFGIRLPLNFDSPYRSASIIAFWRTWHMTLSRFLRDYLYIPLGGNRDGRAQRYRNLMIVMLLGGLWHGAGWTFILWGGLHGVYLIVNHAWRACMRAAGLASLPSARVTRWLGVALTLLAVVVAWAPFRAADLATTKRVYEGMAGLNGAELPGHYAAYFGPLRQALDWLDVRFVEHEVMFSLGLQAPILAAVLLVALAAPSGYRVITGAVGDRESPVLVGLMRAVLARPNAANAVWIALVLVLSSLAISKGSNEFIYFQF